MLGYNFSKNWDVQVRYIGDANSSNNNNNNFVNGFNSNNFNTISSLNSVFGADIGYKF